MLFIDGRVAPDQRPSSSWACTREARPTSLPCRRWHMSFDLSGAVDDARQTWREYRQRLNEINAHERADTDMWGYLAFRCAIDIRRQARRYLRSRFGYDPRYPRRPSRRPARTPYELACITQAMRRYQLEDSNIRVATSILRVGEAHGAN